MYIEKINYNEPDKASAQSLAACADTDIGKKGNMEYFFCDNINNKINRKLIAQHGVKESLILNLIRRKKLNGVVGYLVVEVNKEAEGRLDKQLKLGEGIEKIVLN